ncbi:YdcF family protein [Nocardiopsis sp. HNM0947]|uniref:YdcF family protein n=1 Tax=Nocardiopsis coralli TaxID=2772213 RepID=A0ABR9PCR9_9ACTN|nr:ElyC/SanA/YdcF family protein [Nocardiopsis coralli]MBE3001642.1 YdcF family protein [Nocardiopsis coralli]
MRAPNDGRGDDRWPQESGRSSADRETTQAFTRREPAPGPDGQGGPVAGEQAPPGPEEATQQFTRGAPGPADAPSAPGPDDLTTQSFTRDALAGAQPDASPAAPPEAAPEAGAQAWEPGEPTGDGERRGFTRRFVRGRPAGRGGSLRGTPGSAPGQDETVVAPAVDRPEQPGPAWRSEQGWQPDQGQAPGHQPQQAWNPGDTGPLPGGDRTHDGAQPRPDDTLADHRPTEFTDAFRDELPPDPEPRDPEPAGRRGGDGREPPPRSPRRRRKRRFRMRWLLTMVLVIALAIPPATWGWVWYTARQDDRDASDAIIVLGASQYNGVPSPVFEARLQHAQNLYQQGVAPVIITVGGKQPDDTYTEAAAGRDWLVEVGIPDGQIVAVEEGADTLQSIVAVAEVYDQETWETGIIVSDPWHSLRAERMAADHGIDAGTSPARSGPAVIERSTQLWYITRETASLWYYWIFNDSSDIRVNAA